VLFVGLTPLAAVEAKRARINAIVKGRRAITAATNLRLCRFFGLSEGFWLRTPSSHGLRVKNRPMGISST